MILQRAVTAKKLTFPSTSSSSSSSLAISTNLLLPRSSRPQFPLYYRHYELRPSRRLLATRTHNGLPNSFQRHEQSESQQVDGRFEETQLEIFPQSPVIDGSTKKKVKELIRCLKKFPNGDGDPFHVSRNTDLPRKWDGPSGTILLVNKPKGWTSFTVCGKLRRLVKVQKVGHAGTLDPMATGLLIIGIGKATKLMERYQGMIKCYSGIFRLGEATSTYDADSPVIQSEPWEHIKDEDIERAASSFRGEILQVPPMFSAIKVGGEKMYDKARKGETVELPPRHISIFKFDIDRSLDDRQNLMFRVTCSKGTYIRSLCVDLGKALGSCAHLTALRRDSIGEFLADEAWDFEELQEQIKKGY